MPYEGDLLPVTISCGAAASDGILSIDALLKKADSQLYLHKNSSNLYEHVTGSLND